MKHRHAAAGFGAALVLSAAGAAHGGTVGFIVTLDGAQETPSLDTPATASGTVSLDTDTNLLSWSISYQDLSGPLTASHFHGPAPQCEPAGVQVTISAGGPPSGVLRGSATIGAGQAADLQAGLWYVNLHTAQHQGGEIRGQVLPPPLEDPLPPIPFGEVHIRLETVATGLAAPNWGASAPGDASRLFVTDQNGILWAIDLESGDRGVFLDVTKLIVDLGIFGPDSFDERGLLGVAFHPDYSSNGLLYTYTSEPARAPADFSTIPEGGTANHQSVIREWQVPDPGDPDSVVDPESTRVLLRIDQPQFNHNAGAVNFGPDGRLYVALGDGGGADDKDGQDFLGGPITGHGCIGNGADLTNPLGDILRIDPLGSDSANGQYGIPPENPYAGNTRGIVEEIFASGFRNPFRFSFDSLTGALYAGDVGQNDAEEVNVVVSGGHYGWNHKEGSFFFAANGNQQAYVTDMPLSVPDGLIDPIAQYDHDDGLAIIGGFVYRGTRIPALAGRYVFGEFARTFANDGRLFHLDERGGIVEFRLPGGGDLGLALLGMGQDGAGELFALANATGVPFGDTGVVLRISVKVGDLDADGVTGKRDLMTLLDSWGAAGGAADLNGDGTVGMNDLLLLLANWG